ncbi:MAG: hypothetical protein GXP33_02165 [Spirochaetes bacterium]|nr:hypothetical protein [Spirochaetota bacterium]
MKKFSVVMIVLLLSGIGTAKYAGAEQTEVRTAVQLSGRPAEKHVLLSADESPGKAAEEAEKNRGFLFEIGIGTAELSYGTQMDSYLASATLYGLTRMSISMNLDFGWYIAGNSYLLLSLSATGDRFEDNNGRYMQLNTYLLGPGVKFYPFGRGLSLGASAGLSKAIVISNIGTAAVSSAGCGLRLAAAYDLVNRYRGFGLDVGADAAYRYIEGSYVSSASLFLNLVWK